MITNWRTNIGGAISVTGTSMIGVGILTQLTQLSPTSAVLSPQQLKMMWYVGLAGFVLSCIGKGATAFFAADAKGVATELEDIKSAIRTGDTSIITKADVPASPDLGKSQDKKPLETTPTK